MHQRQAACCSPRALLGRSPSKKHACEYGRQQREPACRIFTQTGILIANTTRPLCTGTSAQIPAEKYFRHWVRTAAVEPTIKAAQPTIVLQGGGLRPMLAPYYCTLIKTKECLCSPPICMNRSRVQLSQYTIFVHAKLS